MQRTKNVLMMVGAAVAIGMASMALALGPTSTQPSPTQGTKTTPTQPSKPETKPEQKPEQKSKTDTNKVTAGATAPAWTLRDLDGKEHTLAAALDGGKNIVVIQWFNPDCPFVEKHYVKGADTFNAMAAKYKDKPVRFFAINSGAPGIKGSGLERNKEAVKAWTKAFPVLLDESGTVGRAYGATRTPEMFVINKNGVVAYHGAIDDNRSRDTVGKVNFVTQAIDELLAGSNVSKPFETPYGCTVKYGGAN